MSRNLITNDQLIRPALGKDIGLFDLKVSRMSNRGHV